MCAIWSDPAENRRFASVCTQCAHSGNPLAACICVRHTKDWTAGRRAGTEEQANGASAALEYEEREDTSSREGTVRALFQVPKRIRPKT